MDGLIVKSGIILVGVLLVAASFFMYTYKKITVNYTVIWGMLGIVMILVGCIPVFSEWTKKLSTGTGMAFACLGIVIMCGEFKNSVKVSQLVFKTREMAMQVSMINQENELLIKELERLARIVEGSDEKEEKKDTVRS